MKDLTQISDADLIDTLKSLVTSEREALCEVVVYLGEVEARKIYRDLGYSSMFTFVTQGLGYSEGAGYRRIQAARCMAETPEVLERIRTGELSLCAVSEISKVTPEKRPEVVVQSLGKSKGAVRELVSREVPSRNRPREKVVVSNDSPSPLFEAAAEADSKGEELYTVTITLTKDEYRLLQEVQGICSERVRSRAVVKTLKFYRRLRSPKERNRRREAKRRRDQEKRTSTVKDDDTASPPPVSPDLPAPTVTRHIPLEVRDRVIVRDEGRCTFVGSDGHRCGEGDHVHLDHIRPFSIGGDHSDENLRVLCSQHNQLVYDRFVTANRG